MIRSTSTCTIFSALTFLIWSQPTQADVEVNPAEPITHRVTVNRIRTFNTSGQGATVFGNAQQEADIIDKINRIWAQAGVEIIFEDVENFTSNFAYDNNGQTSNEPRPGGHLQQILNLSGTSVSASSIDLDMIFVKLAPAFQPLGNSSAAGLARIDRSGTTVFVGTNLLTFSRGRDTIAGVIAHEIGHNLGLPHTANGGSNLMSPRGQTEQLNSEQINRVFTDNRGTDGFDLIRMISTMSNFEIFVANNNLQLGPNGDDDGDSLSNLAEFALGTNPRSPGSTLPAIVRTSDAFTWTIPKRSPAVNDGVNYEILSSSSLSNFRVAGSSGSNSTLITNNNNLIAAQSNSPAGFFRFRASLAATARDDLLTPQMQELLEETDRLPEKTLQLKRLCGCGKEH